MRSWKEYGLFAMTLIEADSLLTPAELAKNDDSLCKSSALNWLVAGPACRYLMIQFFIFALTGNMSESNTALWG